MTLCMKLEMYEQISNHEQAGPLASVRPSDIKVKTRPAGNEAMHASCLGVVFDEYSDRLLLYY